MIQAIWKIKRNHIGKECAIVRRGLLNYLYDLKIIDRITDSEDRELRELIEVHPEICSCEAGYYYDGGVEDVEYSIRYLQKKLIPLKVKINKRKEAYPKYYPDFDTRQGELF